MARLVLIATTMHEVHALAEGETRLEHSDARCRQEEMTGARMRNRNVSNYGGTCRAEPRVQQHGEIRELQRSRIRQTNDPETYTPDQSPVLPPHVLFAPETLKASAVVHQILVRSRTRSTISFPMLSCPRAKSAASSSPEVGCSDPIHNHRLKIDEGRV